MTRDPAPEEPIDPAVRSLLWRLRARLVTPPEQSRTTDDLDRLFAAAREHAHGPELVPEVARIIPPVTAGEPLSIPATGTGVDHTVEVGQEDVAPVPAGVTPLHARRYRLTTMVSRVAAAAVLVVAVGGGLASARDGNGLTIQALLGRGTSEPAEPDTLAGGSAGDEADAFDLGATDLPEPRGVPLPGDDSIEAADAPDDDATTAAEGDADANDAGDEDDAPDAPSGGADDTTDDAADRADGPANAPVEEPTDEIIAAPAPEPAPVEPPAAPAPPADEVVEPPPSEVVGTGGPIPCREDEPLADCFERRQAAEEPADEATAVDDDAGDATSGTDDDAAAREALAKRRGG